MKGRLSVFQRAMLLWNRFGAYNAVHVARVALPLDPERLESAVGRYIESIGLTGLSIDARGRRFEYRGGPAAVSFKVIEAGGEAVSAVHRRIEQEINEPFAVEAPFTPFRFFAVPDGGSFYLGMVYFHLIADADGVIPIISGIIDAYAGREAAVKAAKADPYLDLRCSLLGVMLRSLPLWLFSLPSLVRGFARSTKPRFDSSKKGDAALFLRLSGAQYDAVKAEAHRLGVTLNDLFLAALAKAVSPVARRRSTRKRSLVALSSIASLRGDVNAAATAKTAPFLGTFSVFCPAEPEMTLAELAEIVRLQTRKIKKRKLYILALLEVAFSLLLLRWRCEERKRRFYMQNHPIWGGVSGMNVKISAENPSAHATTDYIRAVSTGLACPLVVSATTFDDILNIAVTYQKAVFGEDEAKSILEGFSGHLQA